MRKYSSLALLLLAAPISAHAQAAAPPRAGDWQVTARVSDLAPTPDDPIRTAAGAATGLHVNVTDNVMPTLGFSYFLSPYVSVEAILGTTQHTIRAEGAGTSTKVHETWVLPPVVSLQYHPWPAARLSPYVGAGVNAVIFYDGHDRNGFSVKLQNKVGASLQAGFDYGLTGPWLLNADVKKVFVDPKATINGGALTSSVHLDPWVVSLGVARRF